MLALDIKFDRVGRGDGTSTGHALDIDFDRYDGRRDGTSTGHALDIDFDHARYEKWYENESRAYGMIDAPCAQRGQKPKRGACEEQNSGYLRSCTVHCKVSCKSSLFL